MMTPSQGWQLADAWFTGRLLPGWRRRTPEEAEALFDAIGLVGPFWRLTPEVRGSDPVDTPGA